MGNCLKTQLKESVNNDNLSPIGALNIKVENALSGNIGAEFIDGIVLSDVLSTKGDVILTATGSSYIMSVQGTGNIIIGEKYKIKNLIVEIGYVKMADVWGENLTSLSLTNNSTYSDISKIVNFTNLEYCDVQNTNITNDISILNDLTKLGTMYAQHTYLKGTLESLVEYQYQYRNNGDTLTINLYDTDVTLLENILEGVVVVTFETGNTVVKDQSTQTVLGTYNGTVWV